VSSEFSFYLNGEKVEMSSSCDESELDKISNEGIFSAVSSLTFNFEYKSPDSIQVSPNGVRTFLKTLI
jgi:hypothetical protein